MCKGVFFSVKIEPPRDKTNKMACAPTEDSDQPGLPPCLIRVFAVRMKKPWALSYPLSAQRRLWLDWADAQADLSLLTSLGAESFCWFCHEAAQIPSSSLLFATILGNLQIFPVPTTHPIHDKTSPNVVWKCGASFSFSSPVSVTVRLCWNTVHSQCHVSYFMCLWKGRLERANIPNLDFYDPRKTKVRNNNIFLIAKPGRVYSCDVHKWFRHAFKNTIVIIIIIKKK